MEEQVEISGNTDFNFDETFKIQRLIFCCSEFRQDSLEVLFKKIIGNPELRYLKELKLMISIKEPGDKNREAYIKMFEETEFEIPVKINVSGYFP